MSEDGICAHEPCTCEVGEGGLRAEDGRRFCSAGCVEGEGCVCPECGCGMLAPSGGAPGAVPPL